MSTYTNNGVDIPFDVVEIDNSYFDEDEKCWTIDCFGTGEDDNGEGIGTVAAVVYEDGAVKPLYDNALMNPSIVEAIHEIISRNILINAEEQL